MIKIGKKAINSDFLFFGKADVKNYVYNDWLIENISSNFKKVSESYLTVWSQVYDSITLQQS